MINQIRSLVTIAIAATAFVGPAEAAAPPEPGDTKTATAVTISLRVGNTGKKSTTETYSPPPGWYIQGHRVNVRSKFGQSSYSVSTIPAGWSAVDKTKVEKRYNVAIDLAVKKGAKDLAAKLRVDKDSFSSSYSIASRSHHNLQVKAEAKGEGYLKGGGSVQMTVSADLVYVGNDDLVQRIDSQIKKLK